MLDKHVEFLERTLVEQQVNAFARGQFALGVLRRDAAFAAAQPRLDPTPLKLVQDVLHARNPPIYSVTGLAARPVDDKRSRTAEPLLGPRRQRLYRSAENHRSSATASAFK